MDADLGRITGLACDHVLAEPVADSAVNEDPATVGVDRNAVIIEPEFPRPKHLWAGGRQRAGLEQNQE